MIKKCFIVLLIFPLFCFSQIGGQSVYRFLNLVQSPRQAALGGKTVTIVDYDVNQAFFNPATINPKMDRHLSTNYSNYFGETTYGTAAYAYTWDRHVQTLHVGANFVNYGNFQGYDEVGNQTNTFTGSEGAVSVGYAYNVPWTDLYLGANVKFITSALEQYSSFGVASDLGALYKDEKNDINYALVIRNIGYQIKPFDTNRESLPVEIIAGISQQLANVPIRWHLTFENLQQYKIAFKNPNRGQSSLDGSFEEEKVSTLNNIFRHVIVGVELFPEKAVNLRLGYNFRRAEELGITEQRNFSGITAGFSLRMNNIRFDFAHARYSLAANSTIFGLTFNLGEN
jgi:hypothetical protein